MIDDVSNVVDEYGARWRSSERLPAKLRSVVILSLNWQIDGSVGSRPRFKHTASSPHVYRTSRDWNCRPNLLPFLPILYSTETTEEQKTWKEKTKTKDEGSVVEIWFSTLNGDQDFQIHSFCWSSVLSVLTRVALGSGHREWPEWPRGVVRVALGSGQSGLVKWFWVSTRNRLSVRYPNGNFQCIPKHFSMSNDFSKLTLANHKALPCVKSTGGLHLILNGNNDCFYQFLNLSLQIFPSKA